MTFTPGQDLTAQQLNDAFTAKLDAGGVSTFSRTVLAQASATTWLTQLGLGTGSPGAANGVALLDSGGKIPTANLPSSILGPMTYQGTWNASTNSPTLTSGTGTKGYVYKCSVAGTTTLDGISSWNIGDQAVFNGTTWDKWDGIASEVVSVAGRVGAVTLTSTDLTDSTSTGRSVLTAASQSAARTALGLGSAATLTAGTGANNVVQFNGSSQYPANDGSLITGLQLMRPPDMWVREEQTSGTAAQSSTGAYLQRILNTSKRNVISGASLSSNTITLPAGTYFAWFRSPFRGTSTSATYKAKLFNSTDSTDIDFSGPMSSQVIGSADLVGWALFTLASSKSIQLMHRGINAGIMGSPASFGDTEIYGEVMIWKTA